MEKKQAKISPMELIVKTISEKSVLKRNVYENTKQHFSELKFLLKEITDDLKSKIKNVDARLQIDYVDKGAYECQIVIAGDILIFHMHTNVFQFDESNPLWKTSYLKDEPDRGYCGIINIYNFLADSFRLNRMNDLGYMIARIFINNEDHFLVQGKRQLGYLYNDFVNAKFEKTSLKAIIESSVLTALDFDLYTPPFNMIKEVTVMEMQELSNNLSLTTGKRLGFKFLHEDLDIIGKK
jgi:hypothetical protein